MTPSPLSILVLGCSYGLLPALKLAHAGHLVTLVGREDEIARMMAGELVVRFTHRRSGESVSLRSSAAATAAPGLPALRTPHTADPTEADFVILAMQEPQFAAPEMIDLLGRIGAARIPCLAIMNLAPPPFLSRLGIAGDALAGVYTSMAPWQALDPALLTLASADAQAMRMEPAAPGELTVTLASNFKAAPFADADAQRLLEQLARDMSHLKTSGEHSERRLPVALLANASVSVPLVKWPMLITGNCRCIMPDGIRSIAAAVHDDLTASRAIYQAVQQLTLKLGVRSADVVPFDSYERAATALALPSSLARALHAGIHQVERIDRLVLNLLRKFADDVALIGPIVAQIDHKLTANRSIRPQSGENPRF